MIYRIEYVGGGKGKRKFAHLVKNREELMALRNAPENLDNLAKARQGDHEAKMKLLQLAYNIGHADGQIAGCKSIGSYFFHDVDCYDSDHSERIRKLVMEHKDEIGLMMLEHSASGGWHLVCKRQPGTTILENQVRVAAILKVEMDTSAKDLQRVVFSTSGSEEDLPYLDDALFDEPMTADECEAEYKRLKVRVMRRQEQVPPGAKKANKHYRPWEEATDLRGQARTNNEEFPKRPWEEATDLHGQARTNNEEFPKSPCESAAKEENSDSPCESAALDERIRFIANGVMKEKELVASDFLNEGGRHTTVKILLSGVTPLLKKAETNAVLRELMPDHWQDANIQQLVDDFYANYTNPNQRLLKYQEQLFTKSQRLQSTQKEPSPLCTSEQNIDNLLWDWGAQIEALFDDFPVLKDICKGLKKNQYPAALIVAGAFEMTLMTRCTYRFYHRPEELRRLNSSALIIGDPASGKSFATRLFKLLAAPIIAADKVGRDAINAYREQMRTKGANKEKPKKPKVVVRLHPARTSNAQFIQDMVNAVEVVDGEEMHLHMLTFDTELDNTICVQKGGSWIDKMSLELKAFHNEEDGQAYSNNDSILQDFNVYWNYVYTGTPIALKKKVNEQNFGSGLATRLTCIPLPATNFQMMSRESTVDYDSDNRLKEWAEKLDRMKGELTVQKIVDELYDWTARRMADAAENDSKADEMLLKRCAYHGLNFAVPFIVMRHWDCMKQDGQYWCGEFETDDVDWKLAELIVNIQYACQRHYFGAMAEAYFDNKLKDASVNVQRRQKTYEGFERLPEEFTVEDVVRCFNLSSEGAARMKIKRLQSDHLIEKLGDGRQAGTSRSSYRKTGILML